MRCSVCIRVRVARLFGRRVGGRLARVAGVGLWFVRIASIVWRGLGLLRVVLLELVPGIRPCGAVVCCVPSATCF